jgi:hypothetical protein
LTQFYNFLYKNKLNLKGVPEGSQNAKKCKKCNFCATLALFVKAGFPDVKFLTLRSIYDMHPEKPQLPLGIVLSENVSLASLIGPPLTGIALLYFRDSVRYQDQALNDRLRELFPDAQILSPAEDGKWVDRFSII